MKPTNSQSGGIPTIRWRWWDWMIWLLMCAGAVLIMEERRSVQGALTFVLFWPLLHLLRWLVKMGDFLWPRKKRPFGWAGGDTFLQVILMAFGVFASAAKDNWWIFVVYTLLYPLLRLGLFWYTRTRP